MVLSWIIRSLSTSIAQTAMVFDTASSLWNSLKEHFSQYDVYRLADLQGEIFNISQVAFAQKGDNSKSVNVGNSSSTGNFGQFGGNNN